MPEGFSTSTSGPVRDLRVSHRTRGERSGRCYTVNVSDDRRRVFGRPEGKRKSGVQVQGVLKVLGRGGCRRGDFPRDKRHCMVAEVVVVVHEKTRVRTKWEGETGGGSHDTGDRGTGGRNVSEGRGKPTVSGR